MRNTRLASIALAFVTVGLVLTAPVTAQVIPSLHPSLRGVLAAGWQRYIMSIPASVNPTLDLTGANALIGQSGPLYYLAGSGSTEPVTRTVTLPPGKFLFYPLVTVECSTVEAAPFFGSNYPQLSQCAGSFFAPSDVLTCTIDGVPVAGLQGTRAQSPLYRFQMPAQDNILGLPGVTGGLSVTDGYWMLLAPLSTGQHVIHFTALLTTGIGAGFTQDVTYNLTVL
ncbi:MAG: hypothetical protein ABIP94_18400 [Planctomycetota bacterium]